MSKRLEILESVIAKGPSDPFPYYARAMELRSLERFSESAAAFESLCAAHPTYVPTYLMAAQLYQQLSQLDVAISFCERGTVQARKVGDDKALSELEQLLAVLRG